MKKILFISTVFVVLMSSCATPIATLLTTNAERIVNVSPRKIENDSIYYRLFDTQTDKPIMDEPLHSIHASEILSGLNYRYKLLTPYYIELPTLAEDTIVDISGSSLVIRNSKKGKAEYVLSLSADENYVIPYKQLASFYQRHSPEAYALHKKGKVLSNSAWGFLGASVAMFAGGLTLVVCSDQLVGYEQVQGPYGPSYEPKYERNNAMFFSGWGIYLGAFICDITSIILSTNGTLKQLEALALYHNQAQQSTPKLTLNTQISNNGIGIALQF